MNSGNTQVSRERRMELAVSWLLLAYSKSTDGGLPAFYDLLYDRWAPSYPETTGYVIPTLLRYAELHSDAALRGVGLSLADYLLGVQAAEGGIPGWSAREPLFIFDTGQVLFGWLAAWQATGAGVYRDALVSAADWLAAQQNPDGYWDTYQYGGHFKVWDVRVAWPLVAVGQQLARPAYVAAGRRCLDWALTQQQPDGWFQHISLDPGEPAVTHTLAYTVEALLAAGFLLEDERYVTAAAGAADPLLRCQRPDGSLSAYWDPGWEPISRTTCLTGSAQMALCWLQLYEHTGALHYRAGAQKALDFASNTQRQDDRWLPVKGAIAGSWPIWGHYLRWRYPNWAVKFFLDASMLEQRLASSSPA